MIEKNIFEIFFNFLFTFDEILDIIILALRQWALKNGGRGEVVNTPDCGSGMPGFDSHRPPHNVFSQTFWLVT